MIENSFFIPFSASARFWFNIVLAFSSVENDILPYPRIFERIILSGTSIINKGSFPNHQPNVSTLLFVILKSIASLEIADWFANLSWTINISSAKLCTSNFFKFGFSFASAGVSFSFISFILSSGSGGISIPINSLSLTNSDFFCCSVSRASRCASFSVRMA